MRKIELTQGRYTLVNDEDYEYLNQWKWCVNSCNMVLRGTSKNGKQKSILMHRVIMQPPSDLQIDHKNGNRLDNRRNNLRICTQSQNCMNRKATTKGISGYKGVTQYIDGERWIARIEVENKKIRLGLFNDIKKAALAYNKAAQKYHGEFALLNNIC